MYAILASWGAILLYLWFRFGNWTFGLAAVLCLIHDLFFTMGIIASVTTHAIPCLANAWLIQGLQDRPAGGKPPCSRWSAIPSTTRSSSLDRIREVRGKNPALTPQMINDSVNQTSTGRC